MSKYHKRKEYERLYIRLLKERKVTNPGHVDKMADYTLLKCISRELELQGCMPMSYDEMGLELQ